MSYIKHDWKAGDIVSSVKLNEMEDGIFNSQEKITESAKLSADLLSDGTTNKLVSQAEKTTWNSIPVVSVPEESTSTTEARFLKVGDTEYKLASGDSKAWATVDLAVENLTTLARGGQVSQNLTTAYAAEDFKNDYVICNVEQYKYAGAATIFTGNDFKKVYVNLLDNTGGTGFASIIPYLTKSVVEMIKRYGFDHNYYKTIALYAGCDKPGEGEDSDYILEGDGVLEGKNVIYLQDVSQQEWEYNYKDEKEAEKYKREALTNDIIGKAFVISIKGATNNAAFLYCLEKSQASYWHSDEEYAGTRWANIEAGKVYPVTFDGEGEGEHGTLRWMVQAVPDTALGSTDWVAVEATDAYKEALSKTGITFEDGKACARILQDTSMGLKVPLIGNSLKELTNIFSFNTDFGNKEEYFMQYIGRPISYEVRNFEYIKYDEEGNPQKRIEKDGVHIWAADVDGIVVNMIIPDNYYVEEEGKEPVPHRNTCLFEIDTTNLLDTNTIYRHAITVRTLNTLDIGKYELNLSLCAVNSEAGDDSVDYLLHSDETYQTVDWILPVSGTIGRIIGTSPKADVIRPTYSINKITLNADYPAVEFEKLWDSLNKQATITVGPTEEPTAIQQSYYLFAWETGTAESPVTHTIRIYKDLLAEGDTTYFFEIDGSVSYKVTTTGDARWWKKNSEDWSFMSGENVIFNSGTTAITGVEQIAVGAGHIFVGWDNVILYQLLSSKVVDEGQSAFGTMNQVARTHQAVRMRAGWQTIGGKDMRTLFVDYVDMAGEWNSVPVITDYNKYDYSVADFRSVVATVKSPMALKAEVAVAKAK